MSHDLPMTQGRFVVIYSQPGLTTEYYGPFVSERLAEEFIADHNLIGDYSQARIKPLRPRQSLD